MQKLNYLLIAMLVIIAKPKKIGDIEEEQDNL